MAYYGKKRVASTRLREAAGRNWPNENNMGLADATGEAELEHQYENIDAPRENVQNGNPTSEEGADALKDDKGFCFTWMFPTTCSRLTCVLAITAAIACIVALTVFGLKTTSNPKSQTPVFPTKTHHLLPWSTPLVTSDSGNESSVPPTEQHDEYDFKATFTTLGAKGRLGPTDLGQHYSGQDHDGLVTLNNGIQHFTVKHTGTYQIEAAGAAAGWDLSHPFRGKGALMKGSFQLNKVLRANLPSIETTVWQDTTFAGQDTSDTLLRCGIDEDNWEHLAEDRTKRRRIVMQGTAYMEEQRRTEAEAKRQERKERLLLLRPPPTLPCDVLKILVGQEGGWMEEHACYFFRGAGGGGGTFVTRDGNTPLIIAGGGGSGSEMVHPECCFSDGTKETTGRNPSGRGVPVQSWPAYDGGGGGGLLTDGAGDFHTFKTFDGIMSGSNSGTAFVNGGKGGWGPCGGYGGFGGGGGGYGMVGGVGWGGGGGYSGGTRGGEKGFVQCAGGGGSFNSGTETFGQSGANGGPGIGNEGFGEDYVSTKKDPVKLKLTLVELTVHCEQNAQHAKDRKSDKYDGGTKNSSGQPQEQRQAGTRRQGTKEKVKEKNGVEDGDSAVNTEISAEKAKLDQEENCEKAPKKRLSTRKEGGAKDTDRTGKARRSRVETVTETEVDSTADRGENIGKQKEKEERYNVEEDKIVIIDNIHNTEKFKNNNRKITLGSIYIPPGNKTQMMAFIRDLEQLKMKENNIIVTGDFNARHGSWDKKEKQEREVKKVLDVKNADWEKWKEKTDTAFTEWTEKWSEEEKSNIDEMYDNFKTTLDEIAEEIAEEIVKTYGGDTALEIDKTWREEVEGRVKMVITEARQEMTSAAVTEGEHRDCVRRTSAAETEGRHRDCVRRTSTAETEGQHRDCGRKTSTAGTEGEECCRDCVEKRSTAVTEGEHRDCGRKTSTAGTEGEECRRDCVEKMSTEDCVRKMCKYVS
ncbi:hypothetical protein Bbelb_378140 [Branchiostoma belcheri]|nr:hypothetical protein Bbelb_378140 [Branchiostoma belcheri]